MGRKLAATGLAVATLLAAASCSGHGGPDTPAGNAPGGANPVEPLSDLPPCGDIGTTATPPDCALQSRDSAGLAFEVRHSGPQLAVTVLDSSGSQVQTLTEHPVHTQAEPRLRDLDGDGRDELIVPLDLTTANIRYAVYHATGDATRLERAGELAGIGIDLSAAGYTVVTARDSYEKWQIEFWTFAADILQPLVTAEVQLLDDGTGHVGGSQCTVIDTGGLARTGLTQDQATDQFCAEPAVQRVRR
ncbi:hypothetical protein [Nocardia sp. NBC_00511]|uniref:hypothetical protein n=1 Tax=Nocardia sp. NBC_00511 TaxID=2903591 RepID=UPI0030E1AE97